MPRIVYSTIVNAFSFESSSLVDFFYFLSTLESKLNFFENSISIESKDSTMLQTFYYKSS